jgi:hypothetical protein
MDVNESLALWSALVGVALPVAVDVLARRRWGSEARALTAFACCLVAAFGTAWFKGDLDDRGDLATAFLAVFVAAITTYNQFWKPSGIALAVREATG